MLRIPTADYVAAHVLAVADDDPALTSAMTLRVGSYKSSASAATITTALVDWFDFPGVVPRKADLAAAKGIEVVQTSAGPLTHVRVPMTRCIAQDFGPALDVELTKELRFAGRSTSLPLGLPNGVRIAAITFEKSPLQMKVTSSEAGNAFVQPQKPTFRVQLTNITAQEQPFTLTAVATPLEGTAAQGHGRGKVAAGATDKRVPGDRRAQSRLLRSGDDTFPTARTARWSRARPAWPCCLPTRESTATRRPSERGNSAAAILPAAIRTGSARSTSRRAFATACGGSGPKTQRSMASSRARNPPSPAGPRGSDMGPKVPQRLGKERHRGPRSAPRRGHVPRGWHGGGATTSSGQRSSRNCGTTPPTPPGRCEKNFPRSNWPWAIAGGTCERHSTATSSPANCSTMPAWRRAAATPRAAARRRRHQRGNLDGTPTSGQVWVQGQARLRVQ